MTNEKKSIRVFCDFDGTISDPDVGATLFNNFSDGRNRGTVRLWVEGKISTKECMWRECRYLKVSQQELIDELQKIKLRHGFRRFIALLGDQGIPLHILSDGLDFYINAFLKKENLVLPDIHAIRSHFIKDQLYASFPYYQLGCGSCGTCKGERIDTLSSEHDFKVVIGDGYSDRCAIEKADLIFARADLVKLCREKSVDYVLFNDFIDIIDYFRGHLL